MIYSRFFFKNFNFLAPNVQAVVDLWIAEKTPDLKNKLILRAIVRKPNVCIKTKPNSCMQAAKLSQTKKKAIKMSGEAEDSLFSCFAKAFEKFNKSAFEGFVLFIA